jgi:WD40 repeat protein
MSATNKSEFMISSSPSIGLDCWDVLSGAHQRTISIPNIDNNTINNNNIIIIDDYHVLTLTLDKPILCIHNYRTGQCKLKTQLSERLHSLSLSLNKQFLIGGTVSGRLFLWNLITGELLNVIDNAHYKAINTILFTSNDSVVITAGQDAIIHCWLLSDLISKKSTNFSSQSTNFTQLSGVSSVLAPFHSFSDHSLAVVALFCPQSHNNISLVYSISMDRTLKIWDISFRTLVGSVILPATPSCLAVEEQSNLAFVGATDGAIYKISLNNMNSSNNSNSGNSSAINNVRNSENVFKMLGHTLPVTSLALNFDHSLLLSSSLDSSLRQWSISSGLSVKIMKKAGRKQFSSVSSVFDALSGTTFEPKSAQSWPILRRAVDNGENLPISVNLPLKLARSSGEKHRMESKWTQPGPQKGENGSESAQNSVVEENKKLKVELTEARQRVAVLYSAMAKEMAQGGSNQTQ